MIKAYNIALKLNDCQKIIELNKQIPNNILTFDSNHIPHLTLLQFYTDEKNINEIKKIISDLPKLKSNLKFEFNKSKNDNLWYYNLTTFSEELNEFQEKIKKLVNKFIIKLENPDSNNFSENIELKKLYDIVNKFNDTIFNPHISLGFSKDNVNLNQKEFILDDFKIELYNIGDYGSAIPIKEVFYFCHRINTIKELSTIPKKYGIELDLRDRKDGEIILCHDPFIDGELFDDFLKNYDKSSIILNVKSERIEHKVIELLKKYNITDYFFLDSSFPMIYILSELGEKNIAVRFSEFESIESVFLIKNRVKWIWVDCFNNFPLTKESYKKIKDSNLKICLVSPELQKHKIERINEFKKIISDNNFQIDAICTKIYNINKWNL